MINPMPLDPLPTLKSAQLRMLFGLNMVPGALPLFLKTKLGRELMMDLGEIFGFSFNNVLDQESWSEKKLNLIQRVTQRFSWVVQNEDWTYWSGQLRDHCIPLLLLTGCKDKLFNEKDLRSYQHMVPFSEHISFLSGDHLMIRSLAHEIAPIVLKFVDSFKDDLEESKTVLTPFAAKPA